MAKFLALLFVALFVVTLTGACSISGGLCSQDSDCCGNGACNPWSGRCIQFKMWGMNANNAGNANGPQLPWRWPWQQGAGMNWPGFQPN